VTLLLLLMMMAHSSLAQLSPHSLTSPPPLMLIAIEQYQQQ